MAILDGRFREGDTITVHAAVAAIVIGGGCRWAAAVAGRTAAG
jgi:hypothetical protein